MLTISAVSTNVNLPVRVRDGAPGPTPGIGGWCHSAGGELTMTAKRLLDRQSQVHPIAVVYRMCSVGPSVKQSRSNKVVTPTTTCYTVAM